MTSDQRTILKFLKSQPMATIATIGLETAQPESALIAFAQTDELEIIFETFFETRKWHNLAQNPKIALVVGWDTKRYITLQYEGEAQPIPDADIEKYKQIFIAKDTPCTETFLNDPRVRLYKVRPKWIRYSDYTGKAPNIMEMSFPAAAVV